MLDEVRLHDAEPVTSFFARAAAHYGLMSARELVAATIRPMELLGNLDSTKRLSWHIRSRQGFWRSPGRTIALAAPGCLSTRRKPFSDRKVGSCVLRIFPVAV